MRARYSFYHMETSDVTSSFLYFQAPSRSNSVSSVDAQLAKGIKPAIAVGNKGFVPDEVSARRMKTEPDTRLPCFDRLRLLLCGREENLCLTSIVSSSSKTK